MPVGVTLIRSTDPYFSVPFPRHGEAAVLAIEVMNIEGGAILDVVVQSKNNADTAWTPAGSFPSMSAVSVETVFLTGLKEEIRYQYTVGGGPSAFCHIYAYDPAWRD
jgi:hypothetical protein